MGIRPGVYLACIYGFALLIILFFVLLYPGIKNPGALVSVKSEPWGAAVLVDGVYMEAAPCEIFVPRGRRRLELKLPGFNPRQIEKEVGGKLVASALFPLRMEISEKLEPRNPAEAFNSEAAEYAAWTFAGEPSAAYQIPLSLSEGAYRLGPAASDPAARLSMEGTVAASARFAVTRASLRDLVRAKTLLDNRGLSPSPLSLLASAEDIIDFLGENPDAALWLGSLLTGDAQSAVAGSAWYAEATVSERNGGAYAGTEGQTPSAAESSLPGSIQAGQLNFHKISGGPLQGDNFPAGTRVGTFYISETLISASTWDSFLEQRPRWKRENADALIREGLVKEGYLETADLPGAPSEGVSGISWYAARAFCEWLSASLPEYGGMALEARLPTEAEWEYAAKTGALDAGTYWEWCEDPFAPLSFLSVSPAAAAALGSPERSLRGGSWVNYAGTVKGDTRASLPPAFCSPFVSARPVIAPREKLP